MGTVLGMFLGLSAPPVSAEPIEDMDLDELNQRAEELEEEYDGEFPEYEDAQQAAEEAQADLEDVNSRLADARGRVAQLAVNRYQGTGLDPTMEMMVSADPATMLESATMIGQLAHNNSELVLRLEELREESQAANEEADEALADAEEIVEDIEGRQEQIDERIDELEDEQIGGGGDGSVPPSARGPGFDGVTDRMASVRDEVIMEFGAPYPVGCLRPGDPQDHGTGRACDFMMSAGGAMPSEEHMALGDAIADYTIANAGRMGIKYVIWKQRIYDTRTSSGWSAMGDRGSITANHYDHVHVSVF